MLPAFMRKTTSGVICLESSTIRHVAGLQKDVELETPVWILPRILNFLVTSPQETSSRPLALFLLPHNTMRIKVFQYLSVVLATLSLDILTSPHTPVQYLSDPRRAKKVITFFSRTYFTSRNALVTSLVIPLLLSEITS